MCKQTGRTLSWKPQMIISISKLPNAKAKSTSLSSARNSGNIDLQLGLRCEKPSSPLPLFKYRCLTSAKTGQGYYLHLFCGLKIRLFTYLSAHLTQNKNKEDREVRISKPPGWFLQDSWDCWVCFYFFLKKKLSQTFYISQAAKTPQESQD